MILIKKVIKLDNEISISYLDNDIIDKKIIVFVHGWGADKNNLQSIYSYLLNDYRIIAVDLPGFGQSPKPDNEFGSKEYADALYKFFKKLNINNINYVGHSFGGKIGIILSALYPDIVNKLVLIDSTGIKPKRTLLWYINVSIYKILKNIIIKILKNDDLIKKLQNKIGSDDYKNADRMRPILVKVINEDFTDLLKKIKCPVFIYWGEKDNATPLWMAKRMNRLIKDSALYIVKNGSHFSFLEDNRIISIIKSFF